MSIRLIFLKQKTKSRLTTNPEPPLPPSPENRKCQKTCLETQKTCLENSLGTLTSVLWLNWRWDPAAERKKRKITYCPKPGTWQHPSKHSFRLKWVLIWPHPASTKCILTNHLQHKALPFTIPRTVTFIQSSFFFWKRFSIYTCLIWVLRMYSDSEKHPQLWMIISLVTMDKSYCSRNCKRKGFVL